MDTWRGIRESHLLLSGVCINMDTLSIIWGLCLYLLVANIEILLLGIEKWKNQSVDDWWFIFLVFVIAILNLFTFHSLKSWNLYRYMWSLELSWACELCCFIWCKAQWIAQWPFILSVSKVKSIADYSHKISWIISGRCQRC